MSTLPVPVAAHPVVAGTIGAYLVATYGADFVSWLLEQDAVIAWLEAQFDSVFEALIERAESEGAKLIERVFSQTEPFDNDRIMSGVYAAYLEAYRQAPEVFSLKESPDGTPVIIQHPEEYADFMTMDWEDFSSKWPRIPVLRDPISDEDLYAALDGLGTDEQAAIRVLLGLDLQPVDLPTAPHPTRPQTAFKSWSTPPFVRVGSIAAFAGVVGALCLGAVVAWIGMGRG